MENEITAKQANHIFLMSVRRRLAEAHQLLKHVRLPVEQQGLIHELISCADMAVSECPSGRLLSPMNRL